MKEKKKNLQKKPAAAIRIPNTNSQPNHPSPLETNRKNPINAYPITKS
jgi:hypothetical protein